MADVQPPPAATAASPMPSALFLREAEVRRGIDLVYFAHAHLMRAIDARLADAGLGRAHHRALYFIARQPGITMTDLMALLAITKQSLARVLADLSARELVASRPGATDRRRRELRLTEGGAAIEAALFDDLRRRMAGAYTATGQADVAAFWRMCDALVPERERKRIAALGQPAQR